MEKESKDLTMETNTKVPIKMVNPKVMVNTIGSMVHHIKGISKMAFDKELEFITNQKGTNMKVSTEMTANMAMEAFTILMVAYLRVNLLRIKNRAKVS